MTASRGVTWAAVVVVIALVVGLPLVAGGYTLHLMTHIVIAVLFATSLNLLFGTTGLLSFGQAAYFGLGAYIAALLLLSGRVPFVVILGASSVSAGLVALVVGYFCVRRDDIYFAMLTLAFGQLLYAVAYKWRSVTGGDDGIAGLMPPVVAVGPAGAIDLSAPARYYVLVCIVVGAAMAALWWITQSPLGEVFRAIRENPERAAALGIDVHRQQLKAFVVAGIFSGLAGSLYAPFSGTVSPSLLHWSKSADPVFMTVLGGKGLFFGPALGAAMLLWLQNVVTRYTTHWMIVLGAILLVATLMFPQGLAGVVAHVPRPSRASRLGWWSKYLRLSRSARA
jgi:branched-chain amino acid transport system permease protein